MGKEIIDGAVFLCRPGHGELVLLPECGHGRVGFLASDADEVHALAILFIESLQHGQFTLAVGAFGMEEGNECRCPGECRVGHHASVVECHAESGEGIAHAQSFGRLCFLVSTHAGAQSEDHHTYYYI